MKRRTFSASYKEKEKLINAFVNSSKSLDGILAFVNENGDDKSQNEV